MSYGVRAACVPRASAPVRTHAHIAVFEGVVRVHALAPVSARAEVRLRPTVDSILWRSATVVHVVRCALYATLRQSWSTDCVVRLRRFGMMSRAASA